MLHEENLKVFKERGGEWYDWYVSHSDKNQRTMVITATTYPNPMMQRQSIYSRKAIFDSVTELVEEYYNKAGIKTVVSGPEGLGATGGELFGTLVQWFIDHKDLLRLMPALLSIAKNVFKSYKARKKEKERILLRSVKFQINLNLSLYVRDVGGLEDIIPYLQQLIASLPSLRKELSDKAPQVEIYISYHIYDLDSDKWAEAYLGNMRSVSVISRIIYKLGRQYTSTSMLRVSLKKRIFGQKIILEKVKVPTSSLG